MIRNIYHFALFSSFFIAANSFADAKIPASNTNQRTNIQNTNTPGTNTPGTTENIDSNDSIFSFLDVPQKKISSGVESLAKTLDEFFSEDKVFYESSGTYLQLRGDTIWRENNDISYVGDFRLRLRLPHTHKKLKLTLETDADERKDDKTVQVTEAINREPDSSEIFTGLQTSIGKEDSWKFKPSLGLRLSSGISVYTKLRLSRKFSFTDWSLHWNEMLFWFDSTGTGFDSTLEYNNKITNRGLFRATSFARWTTRTDYYDLSQTFSILHTLSQRRAVSYYIGAYGKSEPTIFSTHYLIGTSYRQNIQKDYLFLEIIPQILYQKENDFEPEYSLTFRIEFIFKK